MNTVSYSMRGDAVVIKNLFGEEIVADRDGILRSIQNIYNSRSDYASPDFWMSHLRERVGAFTYAFGKLEDVSPFFASVLFLTLDKSEQIGYTTES